MGDYFKPSKELKIIILKKEKEGLNLIIKTLYEENKKLKKQLKDVESKIKE